MKKGFTLIELLAVIVILAIIALIVTPVVSNIVANARIAANARSVEGHIRNIELAIITKAFGENSTGDLDSFDTITSGATIESSLSRPGNDNVTCKKYTIKHGTVLSAENCKDTEKKWSNKYGYTNTNGAVVTGKVGVSDFKGTFVEAGENDTHKGIVYMDPSNIKTECNESSDVNVTARTTKSGCMKFYIYDDTGDTYKMILDRGLTNGIKCNLDKADYIEAGGNETDWNDGKYSLYGKATINKLLSQYTLNWSNTFEKRLISADEIAHIVGADREDTIKWDRTKTYYKNDSSSILPNPETQYSWFYLDGGRNADPTTYSKTNGWYKAYATGQGTSNYAWLYDYTNKCTSYGCNYPYGSGNNNQLYWTETLVNNSDNSIFVVRGVGGTLTSYPLVSELNGSYCNIRPVIIVDKDLIDG